MGEEMAMGSRVDGQDFDVVVIGGGTAGCIVAGRLALGTDRSVLLLEEGPDEEPPLVARLASQPQVIESEFVRRYPEDREQGRGATLLSGRVLGGGWSVNHSAMVRPTDADLAVIAEAGGAAWAPGRLLALMARLEHDVDFGGSDGHGTDGPVRIARRYLEGDQVAPSVRDLFTACRESGVPFVADVSAGGDTTGICAYPYAFDGERRVSSATAHLAAARHRPNLTVRGDASVRRILIEDGQVVGVEYTAVNDPSAAPVQVRAQRVVLAAGVFHSPQILQRSGVGDPELLDRCGIAPVVALPGVGSGFRDHAKFEVTFQLRPTAEDLDHDGATDFGDGLKLHLRLRSSRATVDPDLDLGLRHPAGSGHMILTVRLLEQRATGTVRLDPDDPFGLPTVRTAMLTDADDAAALAEGVMAGIAIMQHAALAGRYELPADAPDGAEAWRAALLREYGSYNHGVGTCRMGDDTHAVVGADLQVHGLEGLTVADASVLPVLPHVNTNYPVALVAEWAADHLIHG
jgi:choline dehydrogenase